MTAQSRTPAGVPTGGQFAAHTRPDSDTSLTAPKLSWVAARELAIAKSAELRDGMHEERLRFLLTTPVHEAAGRMREAADTWERMLAEENIKADGYDPEWAETLRKNWDGTLAIAQQLERAGEHEFGDLGPGVGGHVGRWSVSLGGGEVTAGRGSDGLTYSTTLNRFPNGWKVGQVWSPEAPPKSVIALANRLAKQLP